MRLIDADAYKKHLASFVVGGEMAIVKNGIGNYWINGIHTAYREIDNVPTIEERPHGEIIDANPYGNCSECGELLDIREYYRGHRFCPKCGAMLVEEGEAE